MMVNILDKRSIRLQIGILVSLLFLLSCTKQKESLQDDEFYTCSMDPQVMQKEPGKCPICKMELTRIKVEKNGKPGISLNEEQEKLANIITLPVGYGEMADEKLFAGVIAPDANGFFSITSRISGRIDRLFVKKKGEQVNPGDVLYTLYSEEALQALDDARNNSAPGTSAARNRLMIMGFSNKEIDSFLKNNLKMLPVLSKRAGVVQQVNVQEGGYVQEGSEMIQMADYTHVSVEATVYADDRPLFQTGKRVEITSDIMPNKKFAGIVEQISTQAEVQSITTLVRVKVENREGLLRPGMRATVGFPFSERKVLTIPSTSLIRETTGSYVWVRDTSGHYLPKSVHIGKEQGGKVEIPEGLAEGEEVVTSGAYLLTGEQRFRQGSR